MGCLPVPRRGVANHANNPDLFLRRMATAAFGAAADAGDAPLGYWRQHIRRCRPRGAAPAGDRGGAFFSVISRAAEAECGPGRDIRPCASIEARLVAAYGAIVALSRSLKIMSNPGGVSGHGFCPVSALANWK